MKIRVQSPASRVQKKLVGIFAFLFFTWPLAPGSWALSWASTDVIPAQDQRVRIEKPAGTPLTLDECYRLATIRSETVGIRKEDIELAKTEFFKATGVLFGDIDFNTQEFFQDGGGPGGAGGVTSVGGTFNAERRRTRWFSYQQPIFQGGKSLGAVTGVGALTNQKKGEYIRSKQTLFKEVANAFYDIFKFKRDIATQEDIRELFQERINELKQREDIGRSRPSEVVNAVSRIRNLEADLAVSRGGLQVSRHLLEFLTGIPVDLDRLEEQDLESIIDRDPNQFMQEVDNRPDVKAAKNAITVAWDAIIVAQSGFWPVISFTTDHYEKREGFQAPVTWDFLMQMDVPLFRGGNNIYLFKQAISKWKQAKLNYSLAKRQAELEIKEAYESWHASYEAYKSLVDAVKASNEDFTLQKEDYSRNLVSNLDVLDALERLNTNRRQENQAYYKMKQDYWNLKVAAGEV